MPELDCAHWLLCGWVVVPQVGDVPGDEWTARMQARTLPPGARYHAVVAWTYEVAPPLRFEVDDG